MDDEELNLGDIGKGLKTGKKDLAKIINADRFKTWKNGYKLDKWIFQLAMWLIFGLMFYIAWSNDFSLNYYSCERKIDGFNLDPGLCDKSNCCENPFYEASDWTNRKYLPPGEYGFKPGPLFNNIGIIATILFLIGILLNHLIYNRDFFKKRGRPKWI